MNLGKYILCLVVLTIIGFAAYGQQQRPIQSLYMFDQLLINPAYAGSQVQLSATSVYRNQWVNLEGAPKTFTTTLQSSFLRGQMGLGLILGKDVLGVHEDYNIYGVYSYRLKMPVGHLSFGLQAGFNKIQSDFTKTTVPTANPQNGGVDGSSDPFYRATSAFNPNFGTGLFYSNREFFAGLSVPYLLNNEIVQDIRGSQGSGEVLTEGIKNTRTFYLSFGNTYPVSPEVKIIASTLLRMQPGAPFSFDINGNAVFRETIGLGLSYRLHEGFVYLFELKINENFHVGYAYDLTVSSLSRVSAGSHEFLINYRIKIPRLHKGLECPSYF